MAVWDSNPPAERRCVVAIVDIEGFGDYVRSHGAADVLRLLDSFCRFVEETISPPGETGSPTGSVVKMVGDAVLIVYPGASPGDAVANLNRFVESGGFPLPGGGKLHISVHAHVANIAFGRVGRRGLREIAGEGVNELFRLPAGSYVLSDALKKTLQEETE